MKKHTILFLAANPTGTDAPALGAEARAIQEELHRAGYHDRFELQTRWAAQPLDLLRELVKLKPSVVHFSGARTQSSDGNQRDGIFFQGTDGGARLVSTEALQKVFAAAGGSVRLVVLADCYSEPQAEALTGVVDCVVGIADALGHPAARAFATGLYIGIGHRESVAAAYDQGRAAIAVSERCAQANVKLKVRAGIDARQVVLVDEPLEPDNVAPPHPPAPNSLAPKVDIGILTIRDDEFRAVLDVFPSRSGTFKGRHREYALRRADAGDGESYTVAILRQVEQGTGEAQDAARDLIDDLAPKLVLVVGIAGGLPSDDLRLGDVVVATRIHDFTVEARTVDETTYATSGGPIDRALASAIANLAAREDEFGDWAQGLPTPPSVRWTDEGRLYGPPAWQDKLRDKLEYHHGKDASPRLPIYVAGPIASSDRLVKDPTLLFPWITTARNLLAVEMECGGVFRAARERCPMLAIRGISDIVGLKRSDVWTKYACASAAAFTRGFLRTRPVAIGSSPEAQVGQALARRRDSNRDRVSRPEPILPTNRHRILFLAANPERTSPLLLDQEARAIQMELERSGYRHCFEFATRWAAQPMDLLRELVDLKPAVVHYSGHHGDAGIYFQDAEGRSQVVSPDAVQQTFRAAGGSVRVVVLSSCHTEPLAESLAEDVDCVVGTSGIVSDKTARSFAAGFYGGLGGRESVAAAYNQGRAAISLEGGFQSDRLKLKVRNGVDAEGIVLAR